MSLANGARVDDVTTCSDSEIERLTRKAAKLSKQVRPLRSLAVPTESFSLTHLSAKAPCILVEIA